MGRYSLTKRRKDVEAEVIGKLRLDLRESIGLERFNIAPTQEVLSVVQDRHGRRTELLRWGLQPHWARGGGAPYTMINARAETLTDKPAYRPLIAAGWHRGLVLADGFYEWLKPEDPAGPSLPVRFALAGGESFCFAALWTRGSCTIVTTRANELVAPAHDRMPVVLAEPRAWEAWLDPALGAADVAPLLTPLPAELMSAAAANPALGNWEFEGPDCLAAPA